MIFLNKVLNYGKFLGIFTIIELMLTFIISLLNLFGLNSGITTIILFVANIILIFALSFSNAIKKAKKGLLEGLTLGAMFIFLMYLIKLILFGPKISISTIIYYIILLVTSILGALIGVNKKPSNRQQQK